MGIGEGGMLIVHDTTDVSMRRLQEEFVAIVAHELRTPLTALRGYLQMLSRRADASSGTVLGNAIDQADRLERLVAELFDVTLAGGGRLAVEVKPLSLAPLVRETVAIAQGLSADQTFVLEETDDDVVVLADPARLQQVLLNLLTNALVHASSSKEVAVRIRKIRRRAEIEVEDHGPGIAREAQATLFERFERGDASRRGGLGLGLYISREIIAAHGGTIEVDSEPGDGATFTIRLPLASRSDSTPKNDGSDGADGSEDGAASRGAPRPAGGASRRGRAQE
jgi:signal transduction histidine kinase